jgi:RNA polymerase sigma factor (sigma-70 family)
MTTADHLIIQKLKQGDTSVLDDLYRRYRGEFIGWLTGKYQCSREEAAELFQLVLLIFHDNVMDDSLQTLNSSLKTYLFAIGRNKYLEGKRKELKSVELLEGYLYEHVDFPDPSSRKEYEALLDLVVQSLEELGDPCKEVLELYYYDDKSMQEIAEERDYKNPNTAKNQKYKCLERLRDIFRSAQGKMHR